MELALKFVKDINYKTKKFRIIYNNGFRINVALDSLKQIILFSNESMIQTTNANIMLLLRNPKEKVLIDFGDSWSTLQNGTN